MWHTAKGQHLNQLFSYLREFAGKDDSSILSINPQYGPDRAGDIMHSLASIDKAVQTAWLCANIIML